MGLLRLSPKKEPRRSKKSGLSIQTVVAHWAARLDMEIIRPQFDRSFCRVLGVLGSEAGSVTIRIAGAGPQRPVENRIDPIRDDAAGPQFPESTGFIAAIIFIGRQRRPSSTDGKGRRENNLGQHLSLHSCYFAARNLVIFANMERGRCRNHLVGSCTFLVKSPPTLQSCIAASKKS